MNETEYFTEYTDVLDKYDRILITFSEDPWLTGENKLISTFQTALDHSPSVIFVDFPDKTGFSVTIFYFANVSR